MHMHMPTKFFHMQLHMHMPLLFFLHMHMHLTTLPITRLLQLRAQRAPPYDSFFLPNLNKERQNNTITNGPS